MILDINKSYTQDQLEEFLTNNDIVFINFNQDINISLFTDLVNNLLKTEEHVYNTTKQLKYFKYNIKKHDFNIKKQFFKLCLTNNNITNPDILLNIIMFIRSYNDFSDDFFNLDNIYVNDITEFLDIKLELKTEFDAFITQFAKWYYSIFKCVHKVEFNFLENTQKIPLVFEKIILSCDFITISGIISKTNNINFSDLYLVENALMYISILAQKMNYSSELTKLFDFSKSK